MDICKVTKRYQITIPKVIRGQVNLNIGDPVELLVEDGRIIIIPKKLIDADQSWFWTREWQEKEREADEALRKGEFKEFDSVDDLLNDLHS
jgi:AbrB family looped-hinge helix DNA binding protein